MPATRKDGTVQRHYATVLARLALEQQARAAGLTITKWRNGKPVLRLPMRKTK